MLFPQSIMPAVPAPIISPPNGTINDDTPIEMRADGDVDIFYTVNGKKPDPFYKGSDRFTLRYVMPITLAPGRRTIKALAVSRKNSTAATSVIVTRLYDILDHKAPRAPVAVDPVRPLNASFHAQPLSPSKRAQSGTIIEKMLQHSLRMTSEQANGQQGIADSYQLAGDGQYDAASSYAFSPWGAPQQQQHVIRYTDVPEETESDDYDDRRHHHKSRRHHRHEGKHRTRSPSPELVQAKSAASHSSQHRHHRRSKRSSSPRDRRHDKKKIAQSTKKKMMDLPWMFCPTCHSPRPDDAKSEFCPECGGLVILLIISAAFLFTYTPTAAP